MLVIQLLILSTLLITSKFYRVTLISTLILATLYRLTSITSSIVVVRSWSRMDTLSSSLVTLSLWVTAIIILRSSKVFLNSQNPKAFVWTCIFLLFILINFFSARNLIIFYIWFEASLIPTVIIILIWGYQPERIQARIYFIIYTVIASLPILISICKIYFSTLSVSINIILNNQFPASFNNRSLAWLITCIGFMVKLPIYTTHLWLPKAHVEAPVAGSIILARILLKLGGYGLLRISRIFPYIIKTTSSIIIRVSLTGAIVTRLICLRQTDLKSLIAYSSVGHIGLLLAGVITSTKWGRIGALSIIVAHGITSSALFILANINYELTATRRIFLSKGLLIYLPTLSIWWFLFIIINMAAPPSINLIREIILIRSNLSYSLISIIPLGIIRFFTARYSLFLYSSITHGHTRIYSHALQSLKASHYLPIILHFIPAILLVIKPEIVTLW